MKANLKIQSGFFVAMERGAKISGGVGWHIQSTVTGETVQHRIRLLEKQKNFKKVHKKLKQ